MDTICAAVTVLELLAPDEYHFLAIRTHYLSKQQQQHYQ